MKNFKYHSQLSHKAQPIQNLHASTMREHDNMNSSAYVSNFSVK